MTKRKPYIFNLKHFENKGGKLAYIEKELPFEVKRIYWIYETAEGSERGGHAHKTTDRILICLSGNMEVALTDTSNHTEVFHLTSPEQALFLPHMFWVKLTPSKNAVALAICSTNYEEDIYIKSREEFLK